MIHNAYVPDQLANTNQDYDSIRRQYWHIHWKSITEVEYSCVYTQINYLSDIFRLGRWKIKEKVNPGEKLHGIIHTYSIANKKRFRMKNLKYGCFVLSLVNWQFVTFNFFFLLNFFLRHSWTYFPHSHLP